MSKPSIANKTGEQNVMTSRDWHAQLNQVSAMKRMTVSAVERAYENGVPMPMNGDALTVLNKKVAR